MTVYLELEKVTKNTIRFSEVLESELSSPKIGSMYIPKSTLGELGWKEGMKIKLEVEAND